MDKKLFADLKESLSEATEHASGKHKTDGEFENKIKETSWRKINRSDRPAITLKDKNKKPIHSE